MLEHGHKDQPFDRLSEKKEKSAYFFHEILRNEKKSSNQIVKKALRFVHFRRKLF